jgi:hypothetical protein
VTSDQTTPDPQHSVPRVSFGSDTPEPDEKQQSESDRELQEENAETSLDQPSS